jgi:hypothetical protein
MTVNMGPQGYTLVILRNRTTVQFIQPICSQQPHVLGLLAMSDITARWSQNQLQHSQSQLCQHCRVWSRDNQSWPPGFQCLCDSCLNSTPSVLPRWPFSARITLSSLLSTCQVTAEWLVGTSLCDTKDGNSLKCDARITFEVLRQEKAPE